MDFEMISNPDYEIRALSSVRHGARLGLFGALSFHGVLHLKNTLVRIMQFNHLRRQSLEPQIRY